MWSIGLDVAMDLRRHLISFASGCSFGLAFVWTWVLFRWLRDYWTEGSPGEAVALTFGSIGALAVWTLGLVVIYLLAWRTGALSHLPGMAALRGAPKLWRRG